MRPMFTVHAGEFLVGDYINQKLGKKYEVWVPTKDRGTDLLVTHKKGKHSPVKLQVKFSRGYTSQEFSPKEILAYGWFSLNPMKVRASPADLWVFVTLTLSQTPHFVIVPTIELARRIPPKGGRMWNIYMVELRNEKCYNVRELTKAQKRNLPISDDQDASRDYSKHLVRELRKAEKRNLPTNGVPDARWDYTKYLGNWNLLGKIAQ